MSIDFQNHILFLTYLQIGVAGIPLLYLWGIFLWNLCSRKKMKGSNNVECPLCIEKAEHMVEIRCGHAYCAKCMAEHFAFKQGTIMSCPVCARQFSYILMSYNANDKPLAEYANQLNTYNSFGHQHQLNVFRILRDFPLLCKGYLRVCVKDIIYSLAIVALLIEYVMYITWENDLLSESLHPMIGYIDDILLGPVCIVLMGNLMLTKINESNLR